MTITQWMQYNETILTICISFVGTISTLILTVLIINQTRLLHKQQLSMQKRQYMLDSYSYRRDIYSAYFCVYAFCDSLFGFYVSDLKKYEPSRLCDLLRQRLSRYVPNIDQTIWHMYEAEFSLPESMQFSLINMRNCFESMCIAISSIEACTTYHKENKLSITNNLSEMISSDLDKLFTFISQYIGLIPTVSDVLKSELDIWDLTKHERSE